MEQDLPGQCGARQEPEGGVSFKAVGVAFFRGATRPSAPAIFATLGVALALFVSCIVFVTPSLVTRVNIGYLMQDRYDAYAKLTADVLRMRRDGVEPGTIIMMQTSAFYQALDDAPVVEKMISERTHEPVHVRYIYAPALSLLEEIGIIGTLGKIPGAIVVTPVSALTFTRDRDFMRRLRDKPRLGFHSASLDDELRAWDLKPLSTSGNYFLDNSGLFTSRLTSIKNLITGPKQLGRQFDERAPLPDPGRWERLLAILNEWLATYDANREQNVQMLERFIDLARPNGAARIILLESPCNPAARAELNAKVLAQYGQDIRRFAHEHDVDYWDLQGEAHPDEEDFVDWVHLRKSASRERYTHVLADHLAQLIKSLERDGS